MTLYPIGVCIRHWYPQFIIEYWRRHFNHSEINACLCRASKRTAILLKNWMIRCVLFLSLVWPVVWRPRKTNIWLAEFLIRNRKHLEFFINFPIYYQFRAVEMSNWLHKTLWFEWSTQYDHYEFVIVRVDGRVTYEINYCIIVTTESCCKLTANGQTN